MSTPFAPHLSTEPFLCVVELSFSLFVLVQVHGPTLKPTWSDRPAESAALRASEQGRGGGLQLCERETGCVEAWHRWKRWLSCRVELVRFLSCCVGSSMFPCRGSWSGATLDLPMWVFFFWVSFLWNVPLRDDLFPPSVACGDDSCTLTHLILKN